MSVQLFLTARFSIPLISSNDLYTNCSFEIWPQIWYNTGVNNSDLLNGRGGWLFMCGTFLWAEGGHKVIQSKGAYVRSFIGNCPILLVYPIWAVVSLKLPAISLPIFSGRENLNCLQKVRDVSKVCDILGLLQYPSFVRANTVSESHYARTMSKA